MGIITVGIDLAKNVFAVHSVDENGCVVLFAQELRTPSPVSVRRLHKTWGGGRYA